MNLSDKIRDIRRANDNNKLVVFVGSGVSKNSGIPTWNDLIKEFAIALDYSRCKQCKLKDENCQTNICKERYSYTQDEFLKIPQYFFNSHKSKGHKKYYDFIVQSLKSENGPNKIHDIIMELMPKHIITTNYDKLLESSKSPNVLMYDVIIEDRDFLTHNSTNYIIKMHGDIDRPETIVLKEDDYINYQQEHILFETFIKSLLIDHTFLFVGYSLNDYNLKLILGWIQYLAKQHSVKKERPNNYIIQIENSQTNKYVKRYFQANNILILSTNELPKGIINKYSEIHIDDVGKKVYGILDCILNDQNDYLLEPLSDILCKKYKIFDDFKRISFEDLLSVHYLGICENKGENLYFYKKEDFNNLREILQQTDKKALYIRTVFVKAGIFAIQNEEIYFEFGSEIVNENIDSQMFDLYLNNEYLKIMSRLDRVNDNSAAYYYHLIIPNRGNCEIKLREIEGKVADSKNSFNLIIYKYNNIAFKQLHFQDVKNDWSEFEKILENVEKSRKKAYRYLKKLSSGMYENLQKCNDLFIKHEKQYLKLDNSVTIGCQIGELPGLQGLTYDYYFFLKGNNLMLDHFSNPKRFFEPYIKAILCTYSPQKDKPIISLWGMDQAKLEYKLNSIDFDMLIKYTDVKKLKSWVKYYNVKKIRFEQDVNVVDKFINLCKSARIFSNRFIFEHISNYIYIFTKCELSNEEKNKVVGTIGELIISNDGVVLPLITEIFEELRLFIKYYKDDYIDFRVLLINLLNRDVIDKLEERYSSQLIYVFKDLSKYLDKSLESAVTDLIDSMDSIEKKVELIYKLLYLLTNKQKAKYKEVIKNNINYVNFSQMGRFILEKIINFDDAIKTKIINDIENEINIRKSEPGVKTFPDHLADLIDQCVLLHLVGIWDNLELLHPYVQYSDYLMFILEPEKFDYIKVNTSHYMWVNFFRSNKYRSILMLHKKDLDLLELKKAIENEYATEEQRKIYYHYLLSDKELWES